MSSQKPLTTPKSLPERSENDRQQRSINAKNLILDMLRASAPEPWPVKALLSLGSLFQISENVMRVNLTRLLAKGHISQDDRGYYRLSETSLSLRKFVDGWRQGQKQVTYWDKSWLLLNTFISPKTKDYTSFERTMDWLGFRLVDSGLWLRPNNLKLSQLEIERLIADLSGNKNIILSVSENFPAMDKGQNFQAYWDTDSLLKDFQTYIQQLKLAQNNLFRVDRDKALVESFILGGKVIHFLVTDPLLPDELFPSFYHKELCELMISYDNEARKLWNELIGHIQMESNPKLLAMHD